ERRAPRQDDMDRRPALVGPGSDREPVADGRVLVVVTQPARELGAQLTVPRVDDVLASVFHGRARGREAVLLEGTERVGVRRVPAQGLEIQRDVLLESRVPGRGAQKRTEVPARAVFMCTAPPSVAGTFAERTS